MHMNCFDVLLIV